MFFQLLRLRIFLTVFRGPERVHIRKARLDGEAMNEIPAPSTGR